MLLNKRSVSPSLISGVWSLLLEIYYSVFIFQLGESVRDYIVTAAAGSPRLPSPVETRYLALALSSIGIYSS